jgi:isoquinoline 1-oxidoreductase beta subunit
MRAKTETGLDRRAFLRASAGAGTGLVIAFFVPWGSVLAQEGASPGKKVQLPQPNAFLRIGEDESVTVLLAHSEMGQGIWTTLPMLIAEELGCDWSKIKVEHAPAAPEYAHTAFGFQMTGGSTTTWSELERYRQAGALAREMLIASAAREWTVSPSSCRAQNGFVVSGQKKASYGQLAAAARKLTPPKAVKLKDPKDWKLLGKPTKRLDSPEKVTGRAQFGLDTHFPGLMTAVVARSPVFGGKVKAFRAEKARAVPGVKAVVAVPSGVAVVAEHFWAAKLGRDALEVDWDPGPGGSLDSEAIREDYRKRAGTPGSKAAAAGDVGTGLRGAQKTLEAEYELPYLAHATMEPMNCTVRLGKGSCEIWTGTQFQTNDQAAAAKIAGLKPEQVEIHTMFLGGGFGRRATPASDFVSEAVHVAKASGMPVKVVWTREDDTRGGYYRPMWLHRLRAGLDTAGMPVAWHQTIVGQSILAGTPFAEMMVKDGVDGTSVEGAADSPYLKNVPNHLVELHSPRNAVPVLWWRSVGHTHTAFVMESFVDELAHAAAVDPLEYRRRLLKGAPRHLGVLNLAAEKAGWGTPLPAGRFRGLAVHESFGSFVAQVAEVSVADGEVHVHRVVCAVDCGVCVNPAGVEAQMEGGVVFGLSAAFYGELTLKEGRVQQSNFHDYRLLRIHQMPRVEVHIVTSAEKAGGIGEVAVPPICPAVANAVFAATGQRLRRLPMRLARA